MHANAALLRRLFDAFARPRRRPSSAELLAEDVVWTVPG